MAEPTWPDRAIVVVHGIGEQRRGNTADALVRGLRRSGVTGVRPIQESKSFGEPLTQEVLRVTRGEIEADVYEIYWAPHTARKTTARSVLWWLYRTTFIPAGKFRRPSRKTVWDLSAALLVMLIFVLVALFAVTSFGNLSAQVACRTDPEVDCELPADQRNVTGPEVTWGGLGQVGAVGEALGASFELSDRPLQDLTPSHAAEVLTLIPFRYWVLLMVIAFVSIQALYRVIQIVGAAVQGRPRWGDNRLGWQIVILIALLVSLFFLIQTVAPVLVAFLSVLVVVGVLLRNAARFLAESLGDVQVYAERDENSDHFAAREAVLQEAEKTFELIATRGYKTIVILGHSLGSVIALAALDRLRWRIPPLLERIDTLVTFGTALEKVRYFFERRKDPDEEASERLILPTQKVAQACRWLNLWYANDLVANPITSFTPAGATAIDYTAGRGLPSPEELLEEASRVFVVNINYGYPIARLPLIWTHSRYWGDKTVLQLITDVALPVRTG